MITAELPHEFIPSDGGGWGNQVQLGSRPGSILPQPSKNKNRVKNLHKYLRYTKGVDDIYNGNMAGYSLYAYTIIRAEVLA